MFYWQGTWSICERTSYQAFCILQTQPQGCMLVWRRLLSDSHRRASPSLPLFFSRSQFLQPLPINLHGESYFFSCWEPSVCHNPHLLPCEEGDGGGGRRAEGSEVCAKWPIVLSSSTHRCETCRTIPAAQSADKLVRHGWISWSGWCDALCDVLDPP